MIDVLIVIATICLAYAFWKVMSDFEEYDRQVRADLEDEQRRRDGLG